MAYRARHVYDAMPSERDHRDFLMPPVDTTNLPEQVALPAVAVKDQGAEGACVGHGCAGARETLAALAGQPFVPLSRAFLYYEARLFEGTADQDSGAYVRDGCKVMQQIGVCTEEQFPYRVGGFADVPPDFDVQAAAAYRIGAYTRLTTTDQVRAALAGGSPVVVGIAVYESFERAIGPDGLVPLPGATEQLLGGHCIYVNGYHPDPARPGRYLIDAVNSWGPRWADGGRMHFPEEYLNNPNLCDDLWSISSP